MVPALRTTTRLLLFAGTLLFSSNIAQASEFVADGTEAKNTDSTKSAPWDPENTLFRGDGYRYGKMNLLERTLRTIVAMPKSIVHFDQEDYLIATAVGIPVATLMLPLNNSFDYRFQQVVRRNTNETMDTLFPHIYTMDFTYAVAGVAAFSYGVGYAASYEPLIEYGSLFLEGLASAQILHSIIKLTIGREGPDTETGTGKIYGPTRFFYPAGTPSGHILTYYYTSFLAARYFDSVWLEVLAHLGGLYFATSLIYNDQHFISDVIWGAPMGYFAARWIMRHRSTKYSYKGQDKEKSTMYFVPQINPLYGGMEYTLSWQF